MDRFHRRRVGIGFGIMLLLAAGLARAEEAAPARGEQPEVVVTTEEVVVSATKTPVPPSKLTSAVQVITGEELERRRVKTLMNALRLGQGLTVFSSGGPGTSSTVRIRGGSAAQTLVIIDGAVMNSPTLGQFNFANVTMENIENIEILRGPQSMLWGSDAMGGVINIQTRRGRGRPTASAFFEYGSFLSIREGTALSGQSGPFDYSFGLSRWDFTGFSAVDYRRGAAERDAYRNWHASTRLGLALPQDGRLDFNFRWLNGDTDIDTGVGEGFDVFSAKNTSHQFVYAGSWRQPVTTWWEQLVTMSRQTENFANQRGTLQRNLATGAITPVFGAGTTDVINTLVNRIEVQENFTLAEPLLLNVAYQFREGIGENIGTFTDKIVSSNSGFGQLQLNLWDRLLATAGVRQDKYNVSGSATTWRVTGGYVHPETGTKVRGSYGTGFRAPDINELFFPNFGTPTLKPEESQGFDVGVDQTLFDKTLSLSANYYWNRFRDLIQGVASLAECGEDPFFPGLGFPAFCAQNIGTATTRGVEAGFKYLLVRNHPFLKSLDLSGQFTYTLSRDQETGTRLARTPVYQASAVLGYQPVDPLRVYLEFRYVGKRFNDRDNLEPLDPFDVFNLVAEYDVTEQVQVYTRVANLFNQEYEEIRLFGTPIRSIYGGVRVNFEVPLPGE